jgi:hypothetical protein
MILARTNINSCMRARAIGAVAALLALAAWLFSTASALADPAVYADSSADGKNVFFTTTEKLVPGDTDNRVDVYERFFEEATGIETFVTREVSTGPVGGNDAHDVSFDAISENGLRIFFSTSESLVGEDKDLAVDVYMRNLTTGATIWVSRPDASCSAPSCGSAAKNVSFDSASTAGTRVLFSTEESLHSDDGDAVEDVYVRDIGAGTTALVSEAASPCSTPGCGDGAEPAFFDGASADALTVAFGSEEALGDEDVDSEEDIYVRDVGGADTSLASATAACPEGLGPGACTPIFRDISSDGSHVFYETREQVAPGQDTDKRQDVYGWAGAAPILVSGGPGGGGEEDATYAGAGEDGSSVFFQTNESLSAEDEDVTADVYLRSGPATVFVSTGPTDGAAGASASFERTSPDGSVVLFRTATKLTLQDGDSSFDIYSRDTETSTTTLLSVAGADCTGSCGTGESTFAGASLDNSAVFFRTTEPLVAADTDSSPDVYRHLGGQTTLVSTGPNAKNGVSNPHLADVSEDASHALLTTNERLTSADIDTEPDVYDRVAGETLLVSTRNPDELVLGPAVPALTGTTPTSPGVSTEPRVRGEADLGTSIKVYATPDCSGAPVANGSAAELEGAGILVKVAPGSTSSFHATATLLNDTSACSVAGLTYHQVSEAPGGGEGGGGSGGGGGGGTGSGGGTQTSPKSGSGGTQVGGAPGHVMPHTRITFAPASKTRQRRPNFQFVDSTGQEGTRFLCAVDRGRWRSCSSPTKLRTLPRGRHTFKVKGVNSGLWESHPAARSFKVVSR